MSCGLEFRKTALSEYKVGICLKIYFLKNYSSFQTNHREGKSWVKLIFFLKYLHDNLLKMSGFEWKFTLKKKVFKQIGIHVSILLNLPASWKLFKWAFAEGKHVIQWLRNRFWICTVFVSMTSCGTYDHLLTSQNLLPHIESIAWSNDQWSPSTGPDTLVFNQS